MGGVTHDVAVAGLESVEDDFLSYVGGA